MDQLDLQKEVKTLVGKRPIGEVVNLLWERGYGLPSIGQVLINEGFLVDLAEDKLNKATTIVVSREPVRNWVDDLAGDCYDVVNSSLANPREPAVANLRDSALLVLRNIDRIESPECVCITRGERGF